MKMRPWRSALIGFGKIAAGYSADPRQLASYRYSTHVQVLKDHPAFDLQLVVDPAESARFNAKDVWQVPVTVAHIRDYHGANEIEIAIVATPPEARLELLESMPNLRAILLEKPLGVDLIEARKFLDACNSRNIKVAVNLPRRYDSTMKAFAEGGLTSRWGLPQAVFGVYGNGLRNNGTHLIDLIRMLFGEVKGLSVPSHALRFSESPLNFDCNIPFSLVMESGLCVLAQPLSFQHYREVGLDIWCKQGRVQLLNETLTCHFSPRSDSRQLTGSFEIAHELQECFQMALSTAMYAAYDNLNRVLTVDEPLECSGEEAYRTMEVIEALMVLSIPSGDKKFV